jgi:uncharacterized protein (TIGR02145 family)
MKLLHFLLVPALTLAGTYSGTVVSLDGTPVVGAVIKIGADSVTTTANGTWSLARASGIVSRSGKTISVTSHLMVENGRPRLSFGGMDISGRSRASGSPAVAMRSSRDDKGPASARALGNTEKLRVYWKGKRLTMATVPSDTGNITFRIDTAWKDDHGIPWNPAIDYGSLSDNRDGQVYRTVKIGTQTWMAQNLNYAGTPSDSCWYYKWSLDSADKYGRLYNWATVMQISQAYNSVLWQEKSSKHQGICPIGWHIPSRSEWMVLDSFANKPKDFSGSRLKDATSWVRGYPYWFTGSDELGFRGIAAGEYYAHEFFAAGEMTLWWSATDSSATMAWGRGLRNSTPEFLQGTTNKTKTGLSDSTDVGYSLRCLKDTP